MWRSNSDTLGFFPTGAFVGYALKGGLIAAIVDDDSVAGYLAFRQSGRQAVVVHLCVGERFRGPEGAKWVISHGIGHFLRLNEAHADWSTVMGSSSAAFNVCADGVADRKTGTHPVTDNDATNAGYCLDKYRLDYGEPIVPGFFSEQTEQINEAAVLLLRRMQVHPRRRDEGRLVLLRSRRS